MWLWHGVYCEDWPAARGRSGTTTPYIIEFPGVWLTGYALVCAEDEQLALRKLNALLGEGSMHTAEECKLTPLAVGESRIVFNGDY